MGITCAPYFVDLFLYSHVVEFMGDGFQEKRKKLVHSFNVTFGYADDVVLLNNSNLDAVIYSGLYLISNKLNVTQDASVKLTNGIMYM